MGGNLQEKVSENVKNVLFPKCESLSENGRNSERKFNSVHPGRFLSILSYPNPSVDLYQKVLGKTINNDAY